MAEALKILFAREVQSELFKEYNFYKNSKMDGTPAADQSTISIGQAGSITVERNRDLSSEASAALRTDDKKDYSLIHLSTDPIYIPNKDEAVLAYSKRADTVSAFARGLNDAAGVEALVGFAPEAAQSSQFLRTTGSDSADALPHATATGTRKLVTKADIIKMRTRFDVDKIPVAGRIMVVPALMYQDILNISDFVDADKIGQGKLVTGSVGMLLGFNVFVVPENLLYTNVATPVKKAVGASLAATDNNAILFFHPDFVRRAEGRVNMYYQAGKPEAYGDVMSADLRVGFTSGRTDGKGTGALIQAAGA